MFVNKFIILRYLNIYISMGIFIIENILIMIDARIISSSDFGERFDMNVGYIT